MYGGERERRRPDAGDHHLPLQVHPRRLSKELRFQRRAARQHPRPGQTATSPTRSPISDYHVHVHVLYFRWEVLHDVESCNVCSVCCGCVLTDHQRRAPESQRLPSKRRQTSSLPVSGHVLRSQVTWHALEIGIESIHVLQVIRTCTCP